MGSVARPCCAGSVDLPGVRHQQVTDRSGQLGGVQRDGARRRSVDQVEQQGERGH